MSRRTAREDALIRASIDHWARLAEMEPLDGEYIGAFDCALCSEYGAVWTMYCGGCPIRKKTGMAYCKNTPYGAAAVACDENQRAANWAELEFLLTLLPEGHQ
jgi:hypothetical protein